MTLMTLDRAASPGPSARMLAQEISHYLDDGVRDIRVVIRTAHITTFSGQVILIADFVFVGPGMIRSHSLRRRVRAVCIDTFSIFVDGDEFLRPDTLGWERGAEKLLGVAWSRRTGPL